MISTNYYIALFGVFGLLAIGIYGLLATRNLIKMIIALQIMVKAALLGLIAAGHYSQQLHLSQSLAITVIVADTIIAVLGIAFAIKIRRHIGSLDVADLSSLRG